MFQKILSICKGSNEPYAAIVDRRKKRGCDICGIIFVYVRTESRATFDRYVYLVSSYG